MKEELIQSRSEASITAEIAAIRDKTRDLQVLFLIWVDQVQTCTI